MKKQKTTIKIKTYILFFLLLVASNFSATQAASPNLPVTNSYQFEFGKSSIADTYLSPLPYDGLSYRLSAQFMRAMNQNPKHLIMMFDVSAGVDVADNEAKNSSLYNADLNLGWNMQYRWFPTNKLQLSIGGGLYMDTGLLYLSRNSNNPASARCSLDIAICGMACYSTKIGKLPVRIIDSVTLPSLGLFFAPHYGQTYYEIYLGNRSDLVNCGWWGNHFGIDNLLTCELKFNTFHLRLGYRFEVGSSYINNINTQRTRHSFVIGFSSDWLNINNKNIETTRAIY